MQDFCSFQLGTFFNWVPLEAYRCAGLLGHWYDVHDEDERSRFFPNWEQLSCSLRDRLEATGLVDEITTGHGQYLNHQALFDLTERHSVVAIKGSCGCGKTTAIARTIHQLLERNPKLRILVVLSRRLLGFDLQKVFERNNITFTYYLEGKKGPLAADKLICSVESLGRIVPSAHYDVMILDECPELLQQLLARTVRNPARTCELFVEHVRAASKVLIASDDLSFDVIRRIKSLRQDTGNSTGYYEHNGPMPQRKIAFLTSFDDWANLIVQLARKANRIAVPCSSKEKCKDLAERLTIAGLRVLQIHAETDDKLGRQLCQTPDFLREFDVLLYTSTLGTGVSIDLPDFFDYVFQYVDPMQRLNLQKQALFRVRHVRSCSYFVHIATSRPAPRSLRLTKQATRTAYETAQLFGVANAAKTRAECPFLLELALDDELEQNINKTHFVSRYMNHLVRDCGCEILPEKATFALISEHVGGRVVREAAFEDATHSKERQGKRKREDAEQANQVVLAEHEMDDLKKRQREANSSASDKFRMHAASRAEFMHARDENTGQPAPKQVHASIHADLNQPGFIGQLCALERAVRKPTRTVEFQLLCIAYHILGFPGDPLLFPGVVSYCSKDVLCEEHSTFIYECTDLILACVGEQKETKWYGNKGRKTYFAGALEAYDARKPFPPSNVPKKVAFVLANLLSRKHFGLWLAQVEKKKNACRLPGASVDAGAHRGKSLQEIHETVTKVEAKAKRKPRTERVNMYNIALGPKDRRERMFCILEQRARNGNDVGTVDLLADRAAEYHAVVEERDVGLPETMRGSVWFAAHAKSLRRAYDRVRKESERNEARVGGGREEEEL